MPRARTGCGHEVCRRAWTTDRKSTRLNSSHLVISYAVFCLKKKKKIKLPSYRISKQSHNRISDKIKYIFEWTYAIARFKMYIVCDSLLFEQRQCRLCGLNLR